MIVGYLKILDLIKYMRIRLCERCQTKYFIKHTTKYPIWCPADGGTLWTMKKTILKSVKYIKYL